MFTNARPSTYALIGTQVNKLIFRSLSRLQAVALVQWLWEKTHVPKVVGLNPGTVCWMEIFSHIFVEKICKVCLKRPKINEKRPGLVLFKKPKNIRSLRPDMEKLCYFVYIQTEGQSLPDLSFLFLRNKFPRNWTFAVTNQCDQIGILFFQFLAIQNHENLPKSLKYLPKEAHNFAKY